MKQNRLIQLFLSPHPSAFQFIIFFYLTALTGSWKCRGVQAVSLTSRAAVETVESRSGRNREEASQELTLVPPRLPLYSLSFFVCGCVTRTFDFGLRTGVLKSFVACFIEHPSFGLFFFPRVFLFSLFISS